MRHQHGGLVRSAWDPAWGSLRSTPYLLEPTPGRGLSDGQFGARPSRKSLKLEDTFLEAQKGILPN